MDEKRPNKRQKVLQSLHQSIKVTGQDIGNSGFIVEETNPGFGGDATLRQTECGTYQSSQDEELGTDEEVCFGMASLSHQLWRIEPKNDFSKVVDVPICVRGERARDGTSTRLPLELVNVDELRRLDNGEIYGNIDGRASSILHTLREQPGITIQLYSLDPHTRNVAKTARQHKTQATGPSLHVIIYGFLELLEAVGDFTTKCGIYLQDPLYCNKNVQYRNPHLLSGFEEEPIMTNSLCPKHHLSLQVEQISPRPDLFSLLSCDDSLPETPTPALIKTQLYCHQKQALTFMLQRESGWAFDGATKDIWKREERSPGYMTYTNTITGDQCDDEPPGFRGGLLADSMGLGKTLSMISLIAANPVSECEALDVDADTVSVRSTLLVVPFTLLETWHNQLTQHTYPNAISWHLFHGPRKRHVSELNEFDIVITTYNTLAMEWKKHMRINPEQSLYSLHWHRVVLDEAHKIQNRSTSLARACCAVHTTIRWALSGTPIQNKLTDLASILEFLKVYPFSDPNYFESKISQPWHRGDQQGLLRLKTLVKIISLCRTKAIVNLPKRVDEIHHLDFSLAEHKVYESAKSRTTQMLKEAISIEYTKRVTYLNALHWLNNLRLICNHGVIESSQRVGRKMESDSSWNPATAQKSFEKMLYAGAAVCVACASNLVEATYEDAAPSTIDLLQPRLSECLFLICGCCISRSSTQSGFSACSHNPKHPTFEVSPIISPDSQPIEDGYQKINQMETPTKIRALVENLQRCGGGEKSVVFSYWTFTLDLIGLELKKTGIIYARIDGQMSAEKRSHAVQSFQAGENIKVILVSITCGGAGLDLTAACRAYLMEPQWNPMMEEQALCRVYRMGQKRDVTTIRYMMRNSFEEKVVMTQERKKDLVNLTFSNARLSEADIGASRLQYLRDVLG